MVYVFLADGFEETEALTPVDILRRSGVEVLTVGVTGKTVTSSHNITVVADMEIEDAEFSSDLEAVVLPGGMPGTLNLEKSDKVLRFIDFADGNNLCIAAICAAPSILGHMGLLNGKNATCFLGFEKDLEGATVSHDPIVTDGKIITAYGAGAAFQFGFAIVSAIRSKELAEKTRKAMRFIR